MIFKLLGNKEGNEIHHTIKWLRDIHRNVKREWKKFLDRPEDEDPPDMNMQEWRWLQYPTVIYKNELDEAIFKREELTGLTNSEAECISLLASRIKHLHIRMRATRRMLVDQIKVLINKGWKSVLEKKERKMKKIKNEFQEVQGKSLR